MGAKTPESAGIAIHALGDSFSHRYLGHEARTYAGPLGHVRDWHEPDEIHGRPEVFRAYVAELATALGQRMGRDVSAEQVAVIEDRLMVGLEAAKRERAQMTEEWRRQTEEPLRLPAGAQLYWPPPTTEQRRASGFHGPSMNELTVKQFALIAEESASGGVLLRPEPLAPGPLDHEGSEPGNIRAFYDANNTPISDDAASAEAGKLNSAVDDILKVKPRKRVDETLR